MLFYALVVTSVALTCAMFATRNSMLGFPCLIFWAILGGDSYQLSAAAWDIYYLVFFASMGMAIFTGYAAFTLRKRDLNAPKKDWLDSGKFIDEGRSKGDGNLAEKSEGGYIDEETTPSRRTQDLHDRADARRSGKRINWREFK